MEKSVRERPPVAARIGFYPLERNQLFSQLNHFFSSVPEIEVEGKIKVLVVPHAGYPYSGEIAASAFTLLKGKKTSLVVLVGSAHRAFVRGAAIDGVDYYLTPLGRVKVNKEAAEEIANSGSFIYFDSTAHAQEHSIEVQLPFLQLILGDFEIVPIVMGDYSTTYVSDLAGAVARVASDDRCVFVASSDLSHYHPSEVARKMDLQALELIRELNQQTLYKKINSGEVELCGAGAVLVSMDLARRLDAKEVKVLKYANSGDITGDKAAVVGYAAVCFASKCTSQKHEQELRNEQWLSKEAEKELLGIARKTLDIYFETGKTPDFKVENEVLSQHFGAFVTLKVNHELRGCIGEVEAAEPLYKVVSRMALASALNDPRFNPLRPEELGRVTIEISVLSPFEKIGSIGEIEVGRHGLFVRRGPWSGLLLPQVAVEYNWTKEEFLQQTCLKAGLEPDAWKEEDCEIYRFSAQVFREKDK